MAFPYPKYREFQRSGYPKMYVDGVKRKGDKVDYYYRVKLTTGGKRKPHPCGKADATSQNAAKKAYAKAKARYLELCELVDDDTRVLGVDAEVAATFTSADNLGRKLSWLVGEYLAWVKTNRKKRGLSRKRSDLRMFLRGVGDQLLVDLIPKANETYVRYMEAFKAEDIGDKMREDTTVKSHQNSILTMFGWAGRPVTDEDGGGGIFNRHLLAGNKRKRIIGKEITDADLMTDKELAAIMAVAHYRFKHRDKHNEAVEVVAEIGSETARDMFNLILLTGARPGEVREARVREYHGGVIKSYEFKTDDKDSKPRNIIIPMMLRPMVEKHIQDKQPNQFIFSHYRGGGWSDDQLAEHFAACRDHVGARQVLGMYAWRHAYITQAILAGQPIQMIAARCGNSVATIEKSYAHFMRAEQAALADNLATSLALGLPGVPSLRPTDDADAA